MSSLEDDQGGQGARASSDLDSESITTEGNATMKRAAARQMIERYYYQLTDGCGQADCSNTHCRSSSAFQHASLSPNEAALTAIRMAKEKACLCDPSKPSKVAKSTEQGEQGAGPSGSSETPREGTSLNRATGAKVPEEAPKVTGLTEEKLHEVIEQCDGEKNWSRLIRTVGHVFSNPDVLMQSFLCELDKLCKEELKAMQVDEDKDCDESHDEPKRKTCVPVDLESLRRAYGELYSIEDFPFSGALINALVTLCRGLEMELRHYRPYQNNPQLLNIFVIVFENPMLDSPEYLEAVTPSLCKVAGLLPLAAQANLARLWATFSLERLRSLLHLFQQLITVKVITGNWSQNYLVVDDAGITGAARVLKILYYAVILAGDMDPPQLLKTEREMNEQSGADIGELLLQGAVEQKERSPPKEDLLGKELSVNALDCRQPLIPWMDFINEPLCEHIESHRVIGHFKTEPNKFSFLDHGFLLTPCVKHLGLYYDNRSRMINERRVSLFQSFVHGAPTMPYLRLRIRRDHIIDDALVELEMVAMDNPGDLKKQLFVEFDGEQGIDEGGVSKEFFQLVVEEIFNPDIGMFTYDEETHSFWFNPTSFENDGQFILIGIVLGLAIYNNIILDVHFPMVVYRKLMGKIGTLSDLSDSHPTLHKSLTDLMEYEGDVEETFMLNFRIGYKDVFGSNLTHELKENGASIPVTQENRKEFVELYADFLLNKSIEKQFRAFRRGFQMVTDESPLHLLFHPEEIELLVCGSKQFDFHALEEAVEYDGGFNAESTSIKHFWEVVHEFDDEQKRKLLQFTTGSDRVPIGGLSKLRLIIARNGPDSERLPTSHTCFNVLLLPDYQNLDKLRERILKAITYAKGFGML
ncbi:hypothetical protein CAPTEDRAFT_178426 [Capitella teleta]|uniref:Ubiquitin-protein ligase E3A n=1 Tax=Capitella teleta TaxID=283909 RepID=R7TE30_CAPTE|nr:hypothetical protein CAPTEDRAFT_178426 [Capitella teleta]|eukprot:ELT89306.1 hypothetical protein CAPTEDRAFT_178426 [Capitella teleta]